MSYEIKEPDAAATKKQTWAIKCLGGGDVRDAGLTRKEASDKIGELKAAKGQTTESKPKVDYAKLWEEAKANGYVAGTDETPTPMIVSGYESEPVMDGACGFAWVNFKMKGGLGRKFGQWLIAEGHARKDSHLGGVTIWISEHGQSEARKMAHARAMAETLREAGIEDAYPASRAD